MNRSALEPDPDLPAARLRTISSEPRRVDGVPVPVYDVTFGVLEVPLPPQRPGTWYVVPRVVALTRPERDDLLVPHLLVRNGEGTIVGCRGFGQVHAGPEL